MKLEFEASKLPEVLAAIAEVVAGEMAELRRALEAAEKRAAAAELKPLVQKKLEAAEQSLKDARLQVADLKVRLENAVGERDRARGEAAGFKKRLNAVAAKIQKMDLPGAVAEAEEKR